MADLWLAVRHGPLPVSRAIGVIRPLLAAQGFSVPDRPGMRLHSLTDVFAYVEAEGVRLRIDGGADRPGGMYDQTVVRTEGIAEQSQLRPEVGAEVDEGCRGLADAFRDQVSAPPKKPKRNARPARPGLDRGPGR
ncbi:hypothetical protein ACLGIH_33115 [Streptomyces sp. HMX87]|uniref:hypothetical protein n=1 Tax=Streptomyces sp. HMX87 TaxID=3390849 RepID=UPI003A8784A9